MENHDLLPSMGYAFAIGTFEMDQYMILIISVG